jgi:predicted metal-binding protein
MAYFPSEVRSLCKIALDLFAGDAKVVEVEAIIVVDWVRWKCMYGCENSMTCLACPPHSPTPDQIRALLKCINTPSYRSGILTLLELERRLFLPGFTDARQLSPRVYSSRRWRVRLVESHYGEKILDNKTDS